MFYVLYFTDFVILGLSQNRIQYVISRYRKIFCHFFYSLNINFNYWYSYALRGTVKKTNEKRLVFDFRRSKLVSAIQCFKSFATQTVKHFNHLLQLFDTRLQIIWHFLILFQYSNSLSLLTTDFVILSPSKNLVLNLILNT